MPNESHATNAQIFAFLSDALDPGELAAFEAHVAGCPMCTALVEKNRAFVDQVETLMAPPPLSDLELLNRARAEFAKREGARPKRGLSWLRVVGLGLAVAAAVASVLMFLAQPKPPPGPRTMYAPVDDSVPRGKPKADAG